MGDIKNITGLEKPITKLIETISEGLGVIGNEIFSFDARKIKRISEAEAEAEKQKIIKKAEGQEQALEILHRAEKRFLLEQYTKQINLENIIIKSKEYLIGKKVNDVPVDKDWTARFLGVAQEISKKEIQDLLAKILTGEVQKPETYSLRTLEIIKNLSTTNLQTFEKFVALSTDTGFLLPTNTDKGNELRKYDLNTDEFVRLSDVGLFNQSLGIYLEFVFAFDYAVSVPFSIGTNKATLTALQSQKEIEIDMLSFSDIGEQLFPLLVDTAKNTKKNEYLNNLTQFLKEKGFQLNIIS